MKVSIATSFEKREKADLLIIPFWEKAAAASQVLTPSEAMVLLESGDFKGAFGETAFIYREKEKEARILLVGLGKKRDLLTTENLRRAYSCAVKAIQAKKIKSANFIFPQIDTLRIEEILRGICEGIFLSNYVFNQWKGDSLKNDALVLLEKMALVGLDPKYQTDIDRCQKIVSAVHYVRDLVNGNADDVHPKKLVQEFLSLGKEIETVLFDRGRLEKEGMGLLLAVGRASIHEPCLALSSYRGNPGAKEHVVLVGKGITYDTGGLCLKQPDNMASMKSDMAGAATVLAVIKMAAALKLKVNVTVLAPIAENAIGPGSYKQGDIYRSCIGKSVEIQNTDAEGRLILADAIGYAATHLHPSCIIDIGTLTGGMVIALGEEISGVFSNDDQIAKDLADASAGTGEHLWRMPLHDYKEALHSDIADIVNVGGKEAGAMKCALFLREFVKDIPWAHIDMAGPAYLSKAKYYHPKRGTGWGVRLLLDFLEKR